MLPNYNFNIKPKFYMLVGISGSGKSFIANQLKEIYKDNIVICSSDAIRAELWGDENDQQNPQKVFQILHKRVKKALKKKLNVIYDATNLSRKRRISFLQELNKIYCDKTCIIVATPFNECIENNSKRKRKVPVDVIKRQRESFQCPYFYEGWDSIGIMNSNENYKVEELEFYIEELKLIPHDNPHHEYTIGNHIKEAQRYCENKQQSFIKDFSNYLVESSHQEITKILNFEKEIDDWYWAAMVAKYHDIGKGLTKQFKNVKGEKVDVAHYYNHQNVSAYELISRFRANEILKEDVPKNCNDYYKSNDANWLMTAVLVNLHMEPFFKPHESKAWKKFYDLIGERLADILIKFHEADLNSH